MWNFVFTNLEINFLWLVCSTTSNPINVKFRRTLYWDINWVDFPILLLRKLTKENMCADWLKIVSLTWEKHTTITSCWCIDGVNNENFHLMIKVNKLFSFFHCVFFLKEIENIFSIFLLSDINACKSLETLVFWLLFP